MPKAIRTSASGRATSRSDRPRARTDNVDTPWLQDTVPGLIYEVNAGRGLTRLEYIALTYAQTHALVVDMPTAEGTEGELVYTSASLFAAFRPMYTVLMALMRVSDPNAVYKLQQELRAANQLAMVPEDTEQDIVDGSNIASVAGASIPIPSDPATVDHYLGDGNNHASAAGDPVSPTVDRSTPSDASSASGGFGYPGTGSQNTPVDLLSSPRPTSTTTGAPSGWQGLANVYNNLADRTPSPETIDLVSPSPPRIVAQHPRTPSPETIDLVTPPHPPLRINLVTPPSPRSDDEANRSDFGTITPGSSNDAVAGTSPSARNADFSPACDSPVRRPGCYSFRAMRASGPDPLDRNIPPPILGLPTPSTSPSRSTLLPAFDLFDAGVQASSTQWQAPIVFGPHTEAGEPPLLACDPFGSPAPNNPFVARPFIAYGDWEGNVNETPPRVDSPVPDIPPQSSPTDSDLALDAEARAARLGQVPLPPWLDDNFSPGVVTPRRPNRALPVVEEDEYTVEEWLNNVNWNEVDGLRIPNRDEDMFSRR